MCVHRGVVGILSPARVLQRPHSRGRAGAGLYYTDIRMYPFALSCGLACAVEFRPPESLSPGAGGHTAPRRGARRTARAPASGRGRRGPGAGRARGAARAPGAGPNGRTEDARVRRAARGRASTSRLAARRPPREGGGGGIAARLGGPEGTADAGWAARGRRTARAGRPGAATRTGADRAASRATRFEIQDLRFPFMTPISIEVHLIPH